MTQQVPDTLHWRGETWYVEAFDGNADAVPASETLGFSTTMASTACYRGRADEFVIGADGALRLCRMTVNLAPDTPAGFTPDGAVRHATGNLAVGDTTFEFAGDGLPVPFSGELRVGREPDAAGRFAVTAGLQVANGRLVSSEIRETGDSEADGGMDGAEFV